MDTPHISLFRLFFAAEEILLASGELTPSVMPLCTDFDAPPTRNTYSGKFTTAEPWAQVREAIFRTARHREAGLIRVPVRVVMQEWHAWIEGSTTFREPSPEDREQRVTFNFGTTQLAIVYPAHLDPQAIITWEERILDDPGAVVGYHDWLYEHGWPERAKELEPKVERYLR